jgi:DnaJ-class molecular chaperone
MSGPAVVTCKLCGGTGETVVKEEEESERVCGTCTGLGSVVVYLSPEGKPVPCARCRGTGKWEGSNACPSCLGCGWVGRVRER